MLQGELFSEKPVLGSDVSTPFTLWLVDGALSWGVCSPGWAAWAAGSSLSVGQWNPDPVKARPVQMGPEGELSFSMLSLRTCEHLPYDWTGNTRDQPPAPASILISFCPDVIRTQRHVLISPIFACRSEGLPLL